MALGHLVPDHLCFIPPLPVFALCSYFPIPFLIPLSNSPPISSFSHLFFTQVHVRRDLQDGKGEGWDGWKNSNSVGDQFQAETLGQ